MFIETGDLQNTDPLLGALADNGGPTPTHGLLPGSPAIDAVPVGDCIDTGGTAIVQDQRGVFRPIGSGCEVGAVEFNPPDIAVTPGSFSPSLPLLQGGFDQALTISNVGLGVLNWTLSEDPPVGWLAPSTTTGSVAVSGSQQVQLTFLTVGLLPGFHTTTLRIASNDPGEPEVVVPVTLAVGQPDSIPGVSVYGLLVMAALLVGATVWLRRRSVPRPASS